jgi:hypothetical protein
MHMHHIGTPKQPCKPEQHPRRDVSAQALEQDNLDAAVPGLL